MRAAPRLVALLLLAGLALLPGTAAAGGDFTLFGSGLGHGVGLSQYGAYGLALEGWSATQILTHYYTGVEVEPRDPPKKRYRVGLLQRRRSVTVTVLSGKARIAVGRKRVATLAAGTRTIRVRGGRYRVSKTLKTFAAKKPLRVRRMQGAVLEVAGWGHALGRGTLELPLASDRTLHAVAILAAEEYLYGIGEVPSSWPKAALHAQAIAARTYAHRRVASPRTGCGCDIYADTRDQAYVGWEKESGTAGGKWVAAVEATARRVVTVGGDPVSTFYSSSSGGFTENVENVWGGSPAPHLKGRCDPGDFVTANPNRTWQVALTGPEIAAKLGDALGWNVADVTALQDVERGVSGRVVRMTVKGTVPGGGSFSRTTDGWTLRGALGLKDTRFWVNADRNVTGVIRAAYDDLGCAPGLATGAQAAIAGGRWQPFEQGRMYENAARAAVVWVRGPVLDKYVALGGHGGFLGLPISQDQVPGGERGMFEGGEVYRKEPLGAWEVHGRVLEHFLAVGGSGGSLGFPTSDTSTLPDGTQTATFEYGTITCPSAGPCAVS